MRRIKLLVIAGLLAVLWLASGGDRDARALSRGPFLERSGAPGEETCVSCHRTYPLDSGAGRVEILDLPERYTPGLEYAIRVRVTDPLARQWGFQVTAIAEDGSAAGFFRTETETVQAVGPSQRLGRFYAHQTLLGTYPGQTGAAEWRLRWKAPAEDLGPVTFYAAGNAANGDHTDFFDYVYTSHATVDGERRNVRVRLDAPSSGNPLGAGEPATIRWEATPGDEAAPASFRVLLSTDGGATYPTVIADALPADARAVAWEVPAALATASARIRVVATDTLGAEHADASRANLSIGPLGLERREAALALAAGSAARRARWADATADGLADLAVVAEGGGAHVFVQQPDGTFADRTASLGPAAADARAVAWGDYDADGLADLGLVTDAAVLIYHNEGQGVFAFVGAPTVATSLVSPADAAWTDADGDGLLDVVALAAADAVVVRQTGGGAFEEWAGAAALGGGDALAIGPGIAVAGPGGVTVYRYASGRLEELWRSTPGGGHVASIAWGDVTGDGLADLVGADLASGLRVWVAAGGGARFEERTAELAGATGPVAWVAAGDYDADGFADLVVAGGAEGPRVLRASASGFADVTSRFAIEGGEAAAWVDLDGTGTADLAAFADEALELHVNRRSAASLVRVRPTIGGRPAVGAIVRVDLDGDGDFTTGRRTARALEAGERDVVLAAPGLATARVRVEFVTAGGIETSAAPGAAANVVERPSAFAIAEVRVAAAKGKVVVDGSGLPATGPRVEFAGVALERVKAPRRFVGGDGRATRLVGRDARIGALAAEGAAFVQVVDPATGLVSAPFVVR